VCVEQDVATIYGVVKAPYTVEHKCLHLITRDMLTSSNLSQLNASYTRPSNLNHTHGFCLVSFLEFDYFISGREVRNFDFTNVQWFIWVNGKEMIMR